MIMNRCLVFIIFCLCSCLNTDSLIDNKLQEITDSITPNAAEKFIELDKKTIIESSLMTFSNLTFDSLLKDYYLKNKLTFFDEYFNELSIGEDVTYRVLFLKLSLHSYLKGEKIDEYQIINDVESFLGELKKSIQLEKDINNKVSVELSKFNDQTKKVGDKLSFCLPIRIEHGISSLFYFLGYPYANTYQYADDSVNIEAILTEKFFYENNYDDYSKLIFKCKIDRLDRDSIRHMGKYLEIGDTIELDLNSFGRLLN